MRNGGDVLEIKLRDVVAEDLYLIEKWYIEIDGKAYLSRFRPKELYHYVWYIIQVDDIDIGTVWLEKECLHDNNAILGIMIGYKDQLGKSIGESAIKLAINQCKPVFNFNSVKLNVRESNIRAKKCYEKCGFKVVGIDEKVNDMGENLRFFSMVYEV